MQSPVVIQRSARWFQILVLGLSTTLCFAAACVYEFQPDWCAAVLLYPRWVWLVGGLLLSLAALTREHRKIPLIIASLWLIYGVGFVEEFHSLARWRPVPSPEWIAARESGVAIRIVTLNCNGGNEEAATEVSALNADIVLFQESPLRPKLREMAQKLVGAPASALCGSDVSILARGEITPMPLPDLWNIPFSHAHVRLASGRELDIIAVRLHPYDIRADLWSPDCWRRHRANRLLQRSQLDWLIHHIAAIAPETSLIVAGDFNMQAGDRNLLVLRPRLRDTFGDSGIGWGCTIDNALPVLRIDQVWCSDHFLVDSVSAHNTIHSDHRLVVADLRWTNSPVAKVDN
jgi:endonuclease/exonuclease/phosphatase (EEP) superfamily protein YafD